MVSVGRRRAERMTDKVKLVIVTRGETSPDPARIKFVRSDTHKETSCIDCVSFTDEAECKRGLAFCWPLGAVCCSEWALRTEPHGLKPCKGCGREIPKFYTNRAYCDHTCEYVYGKLAKEKFP